MEKNRWTLILVFAFSVLFNPLSSRASEDSALPIGATEISPADRDQGLNDPSDGGIRLAQTVGPVSTGGGPETGASAAEAPPAEVSDALEPVNRVFFKFNDRLYFHVLKPVAQGYKAVLPQPARVGVSNFFYNLAFPIRFVNCLLQGKIAAGADEFGKFMVNSIFGVAGFLNMVPREMKRHDEDFGQTLGFYGLGPGFYIVWPFLGPSSARDSVGRAGDYFLDPITWLSPNWYVNGGVRVEQTVNDTSLTIGNYEALKSAALDPYIALRDAYIQNRQSLIKQ